MWILPKQLHTLASVQVMKESAEDSEEFCQMSEKSLMWRSKPSLLRTWLTRWKRNSWMQHLSTRTLRPSHIESFVEEWTSYREDSHANLSVVLESKKLLKTLGICSPTSQKESESANLELFSSKMLKGYSVARQEKENQFSNMSEEHWKSWVTQLRSEYSQRKKLASHMSESESSSLAYPTPRSSDAEGGTVHAKMGKSGFYRENKQGVKWSVKLKDAVETMHEESWATPSTMDQLPPKDYEASLRHAQGVRKGRSKPSNLREQVNPDSVQAYKDAKNWATPRVNGDQTRPNRKGGIPLAQMAKEAPTTWMTPQASDGTKPSGPNGQKMLSNQVTNWRTPCQRDYKDSPNDKTGNAMTLGRQVNGWQPKSQQDQTKSNTNGKPQESSPNWKTPITGDWKTQKRSDGKTTMLCSQVENHLPKKGYLNPDWVEQLMGLPIGWTDYDCSAMGCANTQPPKHSQS